MSNDSELRVQLVHLLSVRQAHMDFEEAVADFPMDQINSKAPNCEYTYWHLIEHVRFAQRDILDYIQADGYQWPNFPDDYWPPRTAETDPAGWQRTLEQFVSDRRQLIEIIHDPSVDLLAPLANSGEHGHNILREVHVVASHNAYHTGELGILRQLAGFWPQN